MLLAFLSGFFNYSTAPSLVDSRTDNILHLEEKGLIVLRKCFFGIQFISRVIRSINLPSYVIFLLRKVFADESVFADETEDKRFDTQTAQANLAV